MSIQASRNEYFHFGKAPSKPPVSNQETVEEWQARTGKKPEIIPKVLGNFRNDIQKANKQKFGRNYKDDK